MYIDSFHPRVHNDIRWDQSFWRAGITFSLFGLHEPKNQKQRNRTNPCKYDKQDHGQRSFVRLLHQYKTLVKYYKGKYYDEYIMYKYGEIDLD